MILRLEIACGLLLVSALAWRPVPVSAQSADRLERRSGEMVMPDTYLDPSWPDDGTEKRIAPEESDSVQEVPLDDEKLDPAEAEEAQRYEEELGQQNQAEEIRQREGGTQEQPEPDDEGARDPAQW